MRNLSRMKKFHAFHADKSQRLWIKEGDRNTKFFHKMANAHKRFNNTDQLLVQGELIEDSVRIIGENY